MSSLDLLASPPCPCPDTAGRCDCSPARRARYLRRLRPLLDRVAIRTVLPPLPAPQADAPPGEATTTVATRVARARATAAARWSGRYPTNNHAPHENLVQPLGCSVARVLDPLDAAIGLSYLGGVQVLRLVWTLSDLAGRAPPDADVTSEWYRTTGRSCGRPAKRKILVRAGVRQYDRSGPGDLVQVLGAMLRVHESKLSSSRTFIRPPPSWVRR
ncbi:ATP-binding protein [Micromonosporaceae bacterium B7E4]